MKLLTTAIILDGFYLVLVTCPIPTCIFGHTRRVLYASFDKEFAHFVSSEGYERVSDSSNEGVVGKRQQNPVEVVPNVLQVEHR